MAVRSRESLDRSNTSEKSHRIVLEIRASKTVLLCKDCSKPILEISDGELSVTSKHGSSKHRNVLSSEALRLIAFEMRRQQEDK